MNWFEEEKEAMAYLQKDATPLPLHADNGFFELDSDFRPQELMSLGSSRSGNFFSNRVQAASYGLALSVLLQLRHAPGATVYKSGAYVIVVAPISKTQRELVDVYARQVNDTDEPEFALSGCFDTVEQAEAAIESVGRNRISTAFKTLMVFNG